VKNYAVSTRTDGRVVAGFAHARGDHDGGDFYGTEKSLTLAGDGREDRFTDAERQDDRAQRKGIAAQAGEVIDSMFMSKKALREFSKRRWRTPKAKGVLFSLHLKATMMKVSDPIIFGHAVSVFTRTSSPSTQELFDEARRQRQQRPRRSLRQDRVAARRKHDEIDPRPARLPTRSARAGDGRFGQGHHQPARRRAT
jgi:monomeric isocitrate dehydrogenase